MGKRLQWPGLLSGFVIAVIGAGLLTVPTARAQAQPPAPDPSDIADGMRLYQQKADCQACHCWAGDGRKNDSQTPDSPKLPETQLFHSRPIKNIKAGRPGTRLPAFGKIAYT